MASMNAINAEYGFIHLEWNFFAASHGKGAVDGIGGSVKRSVWIVVKFRKNIVNSALEFYDLARSLSKNIFFIFVETEVKEKMVMLDDKWEGLKNIPGIQSKHFFQSENYHSISAARISLSHLKSA
ncbi:retrovirus-related Pol polyprotein from transposon TNT 1-94 [Trichonephila clavata]|uniref:Retrovirus-related Pol polyprotein from transposon TNT 1-94 n=1 Tax=Trichonephila clavata TaxID=2740835 RepID=A0A8X6G5T9_TRICU|nr:retrovirus-related Pol polyprotein from transposon TNT 1-94 [Trichonephila clavata]